VNGTHDSPKMREQLWGRNIPFSCNVYGIFGVNPAKVNEQIEIPFEVWTRVVNTVAWFGGNCRDRDVVASRHQTYGPF